jgi:PIN domain nuclease of toxin-antitoxin system
MNKVVLDASAILAFLQRERGADILTNEVLDRAIASTVNLAEVQTKLVKGGFSTDEAWEQTLSVVTAAEPYIDLHAKTAGSLITTTEKYGLSLGDRSCLALAIALNAPVYTTVQAWRNLKVGIPIHVIR